MPCELACLYELLGSWPGYASRCALFTIQRYALPPGPSSTPFDSLRCLFESWPKSGTLTHCPFQWRTGIMMSSDVAACPRHLQVVCALHHRKLNFVTLATTYNHVVIRIRCRASPDECYESPVHHARITSSRHCETHNSCTLGFMEGPLRGALRVCAPLTKFKFKVTGCPHAGCPKQIKCPGRS